MKFVIDLEVKLGLEEHRLITFDGIAGDYG